MNKQVIATILFTKCTIFLTIYLSFSFFPFNSVPYYSNFVYPFHSAITLQTMYKTWDAQHYLYISEKGYHPNQDSNAFSPLFPFLISLGSFVIRNSFWSGILISNIVSFVGCYLFYILVKQISSEKIAYASLIALLAFPTSFYFCLIYTESLFFFLIMFFFYMLSKKKLLFASAIAFLLPLTRLIGIAIMLPFLSSYLFEYYGHTVTDQVEDIGKTLLQKKTLLIFSPLGGLFIAMAVFFITTGNWFTQFTAQQNFISHYSFFSLFNPLFFFRALFTYPLVLHGFTNSLLDRLFFIGFICLLPLLYKRVSLTFFAFTVVFGLLPVLSGSFMSYMRYLLVVFPIFITFGKLSFEKRYSFLTQGILFFSICLQCFFIVMQALNYWVA